MNKRIKHITTIALTISVLSSVSCVNYFGITTKAYASEKTSVYLKSLSLNKSDIDFDEDTFYYNVKVDKDVDEIKITAKPKSSDAAVSIDGNYVDENDNYKRVVHLERGSNTIKIKVTNDEEAEKTYTLNIVSGEVDQDDIYLNNLSLSNNSINFSKEVTDYNVNVKEEINKITISAIPEEDMHEVTIDGAKANKEDGYKQTVNLNKGKNQIIVKVKNKKDEERTYALNITRENSLDTKETQDDIYLNYIKVDSKRIDIQGNKSIYDLNLDENTSQVELTAEPDKVKYKVKINDKVVDESDDYKDTFKLKGGKNPIIIKVQDESNNKQRIYTLNLNVGTVDNTSTSDSATTINSNNNSTTQFNQWISENNKWKYNDSTGSPLKNTWFYDKNTNKNYYLQADGTMATGWLSNNGCWYYLGSDGARQSGWVMDNGNWYYLNTAGVMLTNTTTPEGYRVNASGAWIK